VFPTGSVIPLETLRTAGTGGVTAGAVSPTTDRLTAGSVADAGTDDREPADGLAGRSAVHSAAFRAALSSRDAEGAVRAALALEQSIVDEADDQETLTRARAELRAMISALGDAAVGGVQDRREVVGPYVEAMLAVRATVRAEKRYDLSDVIRDAFEALGVEVRDTPSGAEWGLRD
jgi:cysteinyl-tRNA synthetase